MGMAWVPTFEFSWGSGDCGGDSWCSALSSLLHHRRDACRAAHYVQSRKSPLSLSALHRRYRQRTHSQVKASFILYIYKWRQSKC